MGSVMLASGGKRGRAHDAEGTREAILDAAEQMFAEHGFAGARIDAIAAAADYNKSLIFHYFGDKLGLYAAVIRRADQQMNEGLEQLVTLLFEDNTVANVCQFKAVLKELLSTFFDYLVAHPRIMRIFNWEMASGWQTYVKIISQREKDDVALFALFFKKAQQAGLLRPDFDPMIQFMISSFLCQSYLGTLPVYRVLWPEMDFFSPAALARAKSYIIDFVIRGMMVGVAGAQDELCG
jgi:TetR/AcrR family transcriptional regulator